MDKSPNKSRLRLTSGFRTPTRGYKISLKFLYILSLHVLEGLSRLGDVLLPSAQGGAKVAYSSVFHSYFFAEGGPNSTVKLDGGNHDRIPSGSATAKTY